ncbi:Ribosomal_protein L19 [Hexamita inflata]|uniref:Ribosomal protein L19 n=1 Tax=Hexamita inflata TaxID=28002 RepID=A0AA86UM99_9EUKA|nr:Ribosomal protein L19 [Hexamita inflata]CAI9963820.1 Ribosomal protein L19 [Hexamita inflata]
MSEQNNKISLKLQKRLAADILGCGKHRVAFVQNQDAHIAGCKSRTAIRQIISSKLIYRKQENSVSRSRVRIHTAAKRLGRHSGAGKRNGCRDARTPSKRIWIHRMRSQRKMLRKYRDENKLSATEYHTMYYEVKGNMFRNKRVLLETIINLREEAKRQAAVQVRAQEAKTVAEARTTAAKQAKGKIAGK